MADHLAELFDDSAVVEKIKRRLPYLFQLAESESSRAGKIGMQVGSLRESVMIALLIYKFGERNVETEIPITEPEVDVKLFGRSLSIKTISGSNFSGVKLIWTVDAQKAEEFRNHYSPNCDILFVQINWDKNGGIYYIPLAVQKKLFNEIGKDNYIKLPKAGTNPRGVEITKEALTYLINDNASRNIPLVWKRTRIDFNPYKRWIELWREE